MLALLLGRIRHLSSSDGLRIIKELQAIPDQIERMLEQSDHIRDVAAKYAGAKGMLFMGRQYNYPVALEGALKMKEITYIQSEGHPSAELKHGFIALVEPDMPSIFIAPDDAMFDSNVNSIEQVKGAARPGDRDCHGRLARN